MRRNAALMTAFTLSETTLREYQEKVVETIGEKKEKDIRTAINQDRLDRNPVGNREVVMLKKGGTLCYDATFGKYFSSDIDHVKKSLNVINDMLLKDMSVSLNDFYYELGLPSIGIGDRLGWHIDHGLIDLHFSSHLNEDGDPCLVFSYTVDPVSSF